MKGRKEYNSIDKIWSLFTRITGLEPTSENRINIFHEVEDHILKIVPHLITENDEVLINDQIIMESINSRWKILPNSSVVLSYTRLVKIKKEIQDIIDDCDRTQELIHLYTNEDIWFMAQSPYNWSVERCDIIWKSVYTYKVYLDVEIDKIQEDKEKYEQEIIKDYQINKGKEKNRNISTADMILSRYFKDWDLFKTELELIPINDPDGGYIYLGGKTNFPKLVGKHYTEEIISERGKKLSEAREVIRDYIFYIKKGNKFNTDTFRKDLNS